ncbi:hypothetical protein Poli38472_004646 [Pythium oligandrum]|uniref:cysteine--tRNA ligase n=1 Tax=Pythium oligandrum TaxID=41045 RepID=A0A8K1CC06_PYTOL|nr:hypothetical protein Poli38472_004646 [Pythium oligandrum]|eukprot:TMW59577.1 hypothetical protein Poli38472_004646 [Pythium oligandrum]
MLLRRSTARVCRPHAARGLTATRAFSSSITQTSAGDVLAWNSLSGRQEPLPRATSVTPHVLKWYACGPTVYDRAHLGHARAYVSQDILRRVLEKRFQHHVFLVMGVTDVDDKIIKRANERGMRFDELAREEEREFFSDMEQLHVLPPNAITRVSEHMDEIIAYIQQIEQNGFAYAATDGSGVYFNTQRLGDAYGKLDPMRQTKTAGHQEYEQQTEFEDTDGFHKHDRRDFALWKATKDANEPSWPSPWGPGRPGWHIECSAMTHRVLGDRLDVHSGGIDLKFPHHNNEIAQCEAHNCSHLHDAEWCRHFVHFGHLYIRGLKMSKSLKNFISIKEFLATHSADHFRLFCLQYKYRVNIHYSEDRIRDAVVVADRLRNFLRNLHTYTSQRHTVHDVEKRCEAQDLHMLTTLFDAKVAFDAALRDDFDTPAALHGVLELIARANAYLLQHRESAPTEVLASVAAFVLDVLDVFGLEGLLKEFAHLRFLGTANAALKTETSSATSEVSADALLNALVQFRAAVRAQALEDPRNPAHAQILQLCDALRDQSLPPLGVQIEDLAPGEAVFKVLTTEERQAWQQERDAVDAEKQAKLAALLAKQQAFEELMQIAPSDFFSQHPDYTGQYGAFDEDGLPTEELDGTPLSKSQRKKLQKKRDKHAAAHAKYWQSK